MFSVDPYACEAYDTALKCKLYMTVTVVYHIQHIHIYTVLYCTECAMCGNQLNKKIKNHKLQAFSQLLSFLWTHISQMGRLHCIKNNICYI